MRLFVDLDGTSLEWRPNATNDDFLRPGFFCDGRRNDNLITAINKLNNAIDIEVFIISAYLDWCPNALDDKNFFVDQNYPFIDKDHRLFVKCGVNKKSVVPNGVSKDDWLIDDHSPNLLQWVCDKDGFGSGSALKYLNGINGSHKKWLGKCIDGVHWSSDVISIELSKHLGYFS